MAAEISVPRDEAEKLLQGQIDRGQSVIDETSTVGSHEEYREWGLSRTRWRNMAHATVKHIYGEGAAETEQFDNHDRVYIAFGGTPWQSDLAGDVKTIRSGMNILISLIEQLSLAKEPFVVQSTVASHQPGELNRRA